MQKTNGLSNRRANLSETKQAILEKYLRGQVKTDFSKESILPRFELQAELSCSQQRLFFLDHLQSINTTYNIPVILQLKGTLNQEALQQTFEEITRRHGILRTHFVQDGQDIRQIVVPKLNLSCPVINIDYLPNDEQSIEKQRLEDEDLQKTFDLRYGPLLRINLIRLSDKTEGERELVKQNYLLIFTLHHIISDGWSNSILIREFINIYTAFIQGKPSPLAELPIQYTDFAYWQKQWLTTDAYKKQLAYWKEQLKDAPDSLQLPTTSHTASSQNYKGGVYRFELPEILTENLNVLSRKQGVSLFMTLLAAFNVLLYRYSSQNDICIGTPIANRNRQELEGLIGFFVNTLVLRSDLSGNAKFTTLLSKTKKMVLDAQANQDLPFDKLVEELGTMRDLNRTPLFQVMFVMQNTPDEQLTLPRLELSFETADTQTAKFDLTLLLTEKNGSLHGLFEYNTNLFDEAAVSRMAEHYRVLVEGIVDQPELRINDFPLMQDNDRKQILEEWGAKRAAYSPDKCLHQVFESQVEKTPEASALTFENRSLTYRELNERANQLAHYLIGLDVRPDNLIGLYVERSVEIVIGLLGILKAGCAYVPLDPSYPQERIQYLLDDSGTHILITQMHLLEKIPAHIDNVICLDNETPIHTGSSKTNPVNYATPANLAYIIYTSGSTGQPKGVQITHENVLRLFEASEMQFNVTSQDTWTLFHSYAFDFSVWEIWGALLYGGRLVVVPYHISRTPEAFYQLLCHEQVTVLNQTPSAFRQLIAAEAALPARAAELALRYVIFGGEALSPLDLMPWVEQHGDAKPQLINMYGITETTVHVTFQRITEEHIYGDIKSPIGQPLADLYAYVLDPSLNPVPIGIPGELYVGGAGLARGYLNRPELTAERFIPDPYGKSLGSRLYKTGDLACYRENGCIDYLGRIDHQIKIRGFRIELGEIEAAIKKQPVVRDTVALVREDQSRGKYIVAYIVPQPEQSPTVMELRNALKNTLPEYMVPAVFVFLNAFPLTEHGKLNIKALPEPEGARPDLVKAYTAPRTESEEILAGIWSQVLGIEQVGIDDNFFELGGDSIRSLQVLNLAKQRNIAFSLEQLYQQGTIRELLADLHSVNSNSNSDPKGSVKPFSLISTSDQNKLPDDVEDAYPMAALQAGMIFHSEYERNAYHVVDSLLLKCILDSTTLIKVIQQVIEQHPILRTSFDLGNYSEPLQLVFAKDKVSPLIEFEDWRLHSNAQQKEQFALWLELEKTKVFEITKPPLIRFHIHQLSDDVFQFTVTEHHAVLDGWSLNSMLNEIFTYYLSSLNQQSYTVNSQPYNALRDLVVWEREAIKSESHQKFWQNKLNNISNSLLPAGLSVGDAKKTSDLKPFKQLTTLSPEISKALQALARSLSVPLKSVLLAAHLKVLGMLYGEQNITTGLVCSVRPEITDADRALGVFLNTLPFPFQLHGGTWSDLILQVFDAECELMKFRFYPLAQIQHDYKRQVLFDAVFHYVHFYNVSELAQSQQFEVLDWIDYIQPNFELEIAFQLDIRSSEIRLLVSGNGSRLNEKKIYAISEYLIEVLSKISESPLERYDSQNFLTDVEQQQLLVYWNATKVDYPKDRFIHQLFEAQVEKTPDAVAVIFEEQSLTYAELNCKANQLAHYLQGYGVGPDVLVGICLERSLEMVISLLGILKAGGAYVPFDPGYPQDRLDFMLRDVGAPIVLTQEACRRKISASTASVICLDSEWDDVAKACDANLNILLMPENLAYCIYTSGSTGQPKGACLPHQGILNRLQWMQTQYSLDQTDRILQKTPYSFDVSVWEFFWPLMTGARLIVAKPDEHKDSLALIDIINRQQVTTLHFVPSMLQVFIDTPGVENCASLKRVICSGEVLPADLVARFQKKFQAELHNLYGPTEASVDVSYWACWSDSAETAIPIGRPIANITLYILDRQLNPVPVGTPGELHIGGIGLGRGYLNRPGLTAEKFIPNPYSQEGGRLYKTGDLVCYRPDGNIDYLGRIDHQVKIRGFRIELGEIEARLLEAPYIKEAVVIAREDQPSDKRLVAYLIVATEDAVNIELLKVRLKETLPDYMVPIAFVILNSMPLSANGKLDRKRLPQPDMSEILIKHYVAPRTATEKILASIWADLLGMEKIGVEDDFFELGGHSLLAAQMSFTVQKKFNLKLSLKMLLEKPTIAAQARLIDDGESDDVAMDLESEAVLDSAIIPLLSSHIDVVAAQTIFLTGATGFLGIFLLAELLEQTEAKIYCLIRAVDEREALIRLQHQIARYELKDRVNLKRVIAVCGDLSRSSLGLSEIRYREIAERVEVIYHNGALVNFVLPYKALKAANVLGTEEILRLACCGKAKAIHYVSTVSVFSEVPAINSYGYKENDEPKLSGNLTNGYAQSKWVAERLVTIARERGFQVTIYRPVTVSGDSRSGIWNTEDFLCRLIKGCIQMGYAPVERVRMDMAPVDYMGRAIVSLSLLPSSIGACFHLNHPTPPYSDGLIDWFSQAGYRLDRIPYQDWVKKVLETGEANHKDFALLPLLSIFPDQNQDDETELLEENTIRYDCSETQAVLSKLGIECALLEDELLTRYQAYFKRSGFVREPDYYKEKLF